MITPLSQEWAERLAGPGSAPATVVFAEGEDDRIRAAAGRLVDLGIRPMLIGAWRADLPAAVECRSVYELHTATVAEAIEQLADRKAWPAQQRAAAALDPLLLSALTVRHGDGAAAVAGATSASGCVIRAALQGIGLTEGAGLLSSCFLMELASGQRVAFADCAVVPEPDADGLAMIAISTARTLETLTGEDAAVAMLSFSTIGSADHPSVRLVRDAKAIASQRVPTLRIDGELQFDAAFVEPVARSKAPGSSVAGHANVFVFPNLAAGNIGYKIAERIGGAAAYGPILQGLRAPMNDLSRGCSVDDVVNVALISALQSRVTEARRIAVGGR